MVSVLEQTLVESFADDATDIMVHPILSFKQLYRVLGFHKSLE